ncbi:VOC family protein [Chryseolinea sp. T2]|uniref:VOC family protein n=1 Tax=Chryseolinea sp. T2 TaxID=3129255 RepID=UPI0030770F29
MKEKITPCLWFNGQARDAAAMYCAAFKSSKITSQSPFVTGIEVAGQHLTLLDGGPMYKPNASISFYVGCETVEEFDQAWNALIKGGTIVSKPEKTQWSEKYGWVTDAFAVSWQLGIQQKRDIRQKITPYLMFTGDQYGHAAAAIRHYEEVFRTASTEGVVRYGPDDAPEKDGLIRHAEIQLMDQKFMVSEVVSADVPFSEGVSLTVHCENQEEVDYYWNKLTEGGKESMCGWLKDRFGVSWQIIPTILTKLMSDPKKAGKAAQAFMSMRKLDIEQIVQASIA